MAYFKVLFRILGETEFWMRSGYLLIRSRGSSHFTVSLVGFSEIHLGVLINNSYTKSRNSGISDNVNNVLIDELINAFQSKLGSLQ